MAKDLPYFKFISTEWLTGSIALESFELQGLFINVCALYWKSGGILSVKEIEQRYKKKKLLNELYDKYTGVSNGMINIPFLDEQFTEREYTCKKNADNIKKRWEKEKEEVVIPNHTSEQNGNTKSYNKEEEREEEENKNKNKKPAKSKEHLFADSEFIDFEKFEKQFENTDYSFCDLKIYYEKVKNWSAGKGAKKIDWIATVRNFMISDKEQGKLILKNGTKQINKTEQAAGDAVGEFTKGRYGS